MTRLKCKKCGNVFDSDLSGMVLSVHVGPLHYMKCPACKKSSWFNVYSSVKEPVTWPPEENKIEEKAPLELTEEDLEQKRIEDSKYEKL